MSGSNTEKDATVPRPLRNGARLAAALALFVFFEFVIAGVLAQADEQDPRNVAAIARSAHPASNADLFRLHTLLSRGEPRADAPLVRRLLSAPDGRIREFAATPTLSKFGHSDVIGAALRDASRPREANRLRLWHNYQLGVHEPPMFLTIQRIARYFESLERRD